MSYQKNVWKNYINVDKPGTYITAEKMNNIENGIESCSKAIDNLGPGGSSTPNGCVPNTLSASVRISETNTYLIDIAFDAEEMYLIFFINTGSSTLSSEFINDEISSITLEFEMAPFEAIRGTTTTCYIKNKHDDERSKDLNIAIPL